MVYAIIDKSKPTHPFREGSAGKAWFERFMKHHPHLTERSLQHLSYCRALCLNKEIVTEFFGKLGLIQGRLHLISRPMQIYNCDKRGITSTGLHFY